MVIPSGEARPSQDPSPETLPVIEERLAVGTRVEDVGAVRVRIVAEEHEQPVELAHRDEGVEVERVAVRRPVERAEPPWMDGDTLVVPVYAEVPVVKRRLVLVEEWRLHRRASVRAETVQVPVRQERAVVERRQPDGSWRAIDLPAAELAAEGDAPSSATPSGPSEDRRSG